MGKISLKKVNLPNGEEMAFRIGGEGPETILLVHGNLVSSRHWGTLLDRLAESYRVVAIMRTLKHLKTGLMISNCSAMNWKLGTSTS
mgnify:CR=1 FL=1